VFGIALVFCSIPAILLAVIMSICTISHIPKEKELLHQEFGKEWEKYCKNTPKK